MPYKLPLKFIGLWILNLVILLALGIGLDLNAVISRMIPRFSNMDLVYLYLVLGAILAVLEQSLWDRLKGNS